MKDQEVGEVWREAVELHDSDQHKWKLKGLIRSLVQERANRHHAARYEGDAIHAAIHSCPCLLDALRDFGINFKDFAN